MGCTIEARKTGLKAFDKASGKINGCHIRECKELGVLVQNEANLQLQRSAPQVVILLPRFQRHADLQTSLWAHIRFTSSHGHAEEDPRK